jgi:hypothetical protein
MSEPNAVEPTVTTWGMILTVALGLFGCVSPAGVVVPAATVQTQPPPPVPQWDGTFGPHPVSPQCHGNIANPQPGDVLCLADSNVPLRITAGGTPAAPIVYSGNGRTRVPGIHAEANNIVIQGFLSDGADSTGIWAAGQNVTIQDNTVTQVRHTNDDLDAIRFFGDGARVLHNWVHNLEANDPGGSHVDCMQSFATSRPGSSNIVIQGNRCEGIRAQCLMAEGPNVKDGSHQGVSRNWLFEGNYCDAHAKAQSVSIQDIQDVRISRNLLAGKASKAIALGQNSTGVLVTLDNVIGPGYKRLVGFDDLTVRLGYQGPSGQE